MTFARSCVFAFCFTGLLAAVAPRLGPAPHVAPRIVVQPAPASSSVRQADDSAQTNNRAQPAQQAYRLPPEKLAKAIALSRIRNILDLAGAFWGLAVLWLLLATRAAAGLEGWARRVSRPHWLQGLLFFAVFLVILTLASLPLDAFGHHISRDYGISVQGWGSWLGDQGKALGLAVLIGAPVLLLFNWIVRHWPRRYWLGVWVVTLPLLMLSVFVSPLLEPIFNQYEPLARNHPALVAELEKIVARTGTKIPPDRMFLMKASVKTNGLNAYVSGIGATKRIVVWDTTAGRIPNDEVQFIFGHESGHYVLRHIPKGLALTAVALFFVYWACAGLAAWLARSFGVRWQLNRLDGGQANGAEPLASRAGFVVLLFVLSLASFVLAPLDNTVSRHFEHEADLYGQEAIHGIVADPQKTAVASFNALGEAWLDDPNPSPFIEFWEYDHPSTQTRANFALHYDPWANGGHGEFFDK
jgi:Zn-dependent protease with chaperone function